MKTLQNLLSGALGCIVFFIAHGQAAVLESPLDTWQIVASPLQSLRGIAYQDGRFAAVGFSTNIVVSTNGTHWFLVTNGLNGSFEGLLAVTAGAGQFVAVGGSIGVILSSSDGLQWTRRHTLNGAEFWAVTYAAGQFVAVGFRNPGGAISATSPDGIHWESFNLPINTTPRNVAYGNGKYVAAGAPVSMLSTNGRDWAPINSVLAQGIAFDGGRFIATLGTNGFTSADGTNWTEFPLPDLVAGQAEQNYYTARYANGTVITGGHAGRYGLLVTSTGGGPYTPVPKAVSESMGAIRDAVFVDGHFYLADQAGRIWRSGRIAPAGLPVFKGLSRLGAQTRISFSAPAGFHYTLECTQRLDSPEWLSCVGPVFASGDEVTVIDSNAGGETRYYRLLIR